MRLLDVATALARWLAPRQAAEQDARLARSKRVEGLMERASDRTEALRSSARQGDARLAHRR